MNKKKLFWSLLTILFASMFSVNFISCGNDDDDNPTHNGSTITENDPEGTIMINIMNDDKDVQIDGEWPYLYVGMTPQNNIDTWYYNGQIVSVGKVKGLSAITKIPDSGWAERCAATAGCGYIIRQSKASANNSRVIDGYKYCRVYLVDFVTNTSGGIMGATIKYQMWNPEQ